MSTSQSHLSKTRIDLAGRRLREQLESPSILDADTNKVTADDIAVVNAYRQSYADALLRVRMGLTSFRRTIGHADASITQRTKRYDRIVSKLVRFETQRLSQMQDIGGLRVVLDDRSGVDLMVERIMEQWSGDVYRQYDYVAVPQPSGYRAHHIVVNRGARLIEIQIRTENQHIWAESVESSGRLIDVELKWGDGPTVVHAYYRLLGTVLDLADQHADASDELFQKTIAARDRAQQRMLMMLRGGAANG